MNSDIIVRDWMKQCPYVQNEYAQKNGVTSLEYGIYPTVIQQSYHENVLGELVADEIQEALFILTSEIRYKDANAQRYSNYRNIIEWLDEQNKKMNFPRLREGRVRSVSSKMSQYVSEPNNLMERFEIQIRFSYKRNST